jgi:hypothetical protein
LIRVSTRRLGSRCPRQLGAEVVEAIRSDADDLKPGGAECLAKLPSKALLYLTAERPSAIAIPTDLFAAAVGE